MYKYDMRECSRCGARPVMGTFCQECRQEFRQETILLDIFRNMSKEEKEELLTKYTTKKDTPLPSCSPLY